jgi:RNA polymerase sigma-70 factor (ECF subfamily)
MAIGNWLREKTAPLRAASPIPMDSMMVNVLTDVQRYAQFRLGNLEDAEDAAMETWQAISARPEPFLTADDPRRYAIGICRRKVADQIRRRRWKLAISPAPEPADPDQQLMVSRTLAQLPDDQREVLALKYFHQFSAAEIAQIMGRTPVAINSLLQRARDAFAAAAQPWFNEEP